MLGFWKLHSQIDDCWCIHFDWNLHHHYHLLLQNLASTHLHAHSLIPIHHLHHLFVHSFQMKNNSCHVWCVFHVHQWKNCCLLHFKTMNKDLINIFCSISNITITFPFHTCIDFSARHHFVIVTDPWYAKSELSMSPSCSPISYSISTDLQDASMPVSFSSPFFIFHSRFLKLSFTKLLFLSLLLTLLTSQLLLPFMLVLYILLLLSLVVVNQHHLLLLLLHLKILTN